MSLARNIQPAGLIPVLQAFTGHAHPPLLGETIPTQGTQGKHPYQLDLVFSNPYSNSWALKLSDRRGNTVWLSRKAGTGVLSVCTDPSNAATCVQAETSRELITAIRQNWPDLRRVPLVAFVVRHLRGVDLYAPARVAAVPLRHPLQETAALAGE